MKKMIILGIAFLSIIAIVLTLHPKHSADEIKDKYSQLESMLILTTEDGNIDFDNMNINDHQYIAYCLKAVARLKENTKYTRELTKYLVDHADDNNDGEIGWGLGYAWSGFYTPNPKWHVYAIEVANVIDAYIEALDSGLLTKELAKEVKNQLHDTVMIWNQKYWSENGSSGEKDFYWYSISEENAIGCINIDAKMVGSQAKLLAKYNDLFTKEEKELVYNHIDRSYSKIMQNSYLEDGYIKWNYLEKKDLDKENHTINDSIHHGFILEGIYDYQKYRLNKISILSDSKYTDLITKSIKDDIIYRYPDHSAYQCYDTGTIRWVPNKTEQKRILLKSYDLYTNSDTVERQLTFLLDAFSIYISQYN